MTLKKFPALVMGGAGFSYQLHAHPESLPIREILLRAFDLGLRTIDTSPYYEPSEQLLGAALTHPDITSQYMRHRYQIMTKVGRISEKKFDYSPTGVRHSIERSLQRFHTTYLDCVFCHDVEFVTIEEAVCAVGVLLEYKAAGIIHRVGVSGQNMRILAQVALLVRERFGQPLDTIQTWAQLTLQNTLAESWGFGLFKAAGVKTVFCSSPLAVGLLRNGGIPQGVGGDVWHPAPRELRKASQKAAEWTEKQGESLASVALRYAIAKARENTTADFTVSIITGISTMTDLEQNVQAAKQILTIPRSSSSGNQSGGVVPDTLDQFSELDQAAFLRDQHLYKNIRSIIGQWIDYDFSGQPEKIQKEDNSISKQALRPTCTA